MKDFTTLHWVGDETGHLRMIDQTLLPEEFVEIDCTTVEVVWEAIRSLRERRPAIGIAAGFGICVGIQSVLDAEEDTFFGQLTKVSNYLAESRPTAVNLFWALDRMCARAARERGRGSRVIAQCLLEEAKAIDEEDREMCHAMGRFGAELIEDSATILTHCNAGGLATGDYGTALAPIYSAVAAGKKVQVFADETRPLLQGARLTTWELMQRGVDVTLICDSMAARVMSEGKIQAVIVGSDRIAANGDVCNKIGTYGVALAAKAHGIPFYVVAPSSTFDLSLETGSEIPIEERDAEEITCGFGGTAPEGVKVYNPAFDVTPADLVTALVCEKGVIQPVTKEKIEEVLA